MPDKQISLWLQWLGEWLTYAWVFGLSALGGAVNYLQRLRRPQARLQWRVLAVELLTSGFVGLLTFWLCQAGQLSAPITAVMVGIAGHMGTRALFRIERVYSRLLGEEVDP